MRETHKDSRTCKACNSSSGTRFITKGKLSGIASVVALFAFLTAWSKAQSTIDFTVGSTAPVRVNPEPRSVASVQSGPRLTIIDQITWEVICPDGDEQMVAAQNTVGLKHERAMAAFTISDPVGAARLVSETANELLAKEMILGPLLKPDVEDLGTWIASKPPKEREEIQKAIVAILVPTPVN